MSEKQQDVHAIRRWFNAHVESSLLQTTLQLKLLDPLLNQPHTPLSLAQAYGYDAHGVRVLLQGLAGLGILSPNKEGAFEFVAGQQAAFTPGDSAYIGNAVAEAQQFWFAASEVEQQQMDRLLSLAEAAVIQAPEEVAWLIERAWAFVWTASLMALAEWGVFELLQERPYSLSDLASQSDCSPAMLQPLLQAGEQCGILTTFADEVALTEAALVAFGMGMIKMYARWFSRRLGMERQFFWPALGQLTQCVEDGRPAARHSIPGENGAFRQRFIQINRPLLPLLQRVADKIAISLKAQKRPVQLLEVGAGLGNWGMAWAKVHSESRVTAVDIQEALRETEQVVATASLSACYTWQPDNILTARYPPATYDIIILNEICHTIPPRHLAEWLQYIARAIKPGGLLLIADMVLDDDYVAPQRHLLSGVKLFVSGGGQLMNTADFLTQLQQAGLQQMRLHRLPTTDFMIARKPENM